ncbi:ribosome-binding ATPase YchF [Tanacetum coccineum]
MRVGECSDFRSKLESTQVDGTKGPVFENGPNFDTAFRLFHGQNGVVPLSEPSSSHTSFNEANQTVIRRFSKFIEYHARGVHYGSELAIVQEVQIEKRIEKLKKSKASYPQVKSKDAEKSALEKILQALMDEKPTRSVALTDFEKESIQHMCLLTMKPVIYVANVTESDLATPESNLHVKNVMELASQLQSGILIVSAQVESELTELPTEERAEFLTSLGVDESGHGNLIRATYNLLGLRTYFTSEKKAWTIHAGMTAPQAVGVIHSDFEKGFTHAPSTRRLTVQRPRAVDKQKSKENGEGLTKRMADDDTVLAFYHHDFSDVKLMAGDMQR